MQRVVAVDTASRDRSGAVLAEQARPGGGVRHGALDRLRRLRSAGPCSTRRPARRCRCRAGGQSGRGRPGRGQQIEWIWLLHDDCEPAPDALEQLLRGAAETPNAAVLGPKVLDWSDRDVILEAGLTIDTVGRRITGIEPREVDQGQHDGDRDTLAVGSAGMLIRRDVWDLVRGFEPAMALFREDVDFCWRVHAAGFRVRVITDAVVFHAQAAARRRRAVSVGRRPQLLNRRNALLTLGFGNLPTGADAHSRWLLQHLRVVPARAVLPAGQAGHRGAGRERGDRLGARRAPAAADAQRAPACGPGPPKAAYGRLRSEIPPGRLQCGGWRSSATWPCSPRDAAGRGGLRTTRPRTSTEADDFAADRQRLRAADPEPTRRPDVHRPGPRGRGRPSGRCSSAGPLGGGALLAGLGAYRPAL